MAELTREEVLAIAHELYESHRLSDRQYATWRAYRYDGRPSREAAAYLRETYHYEISHTLVIAESRYAHEIVVAACLEAAEGRVRLGHTLQAGSDSWFSPDTTLQAVARRVRALRSKKKTVDRCALR